MKAPKFGAKSESVRTLQIALLEAGYELVRWGADGALGSETWNALADAAADHQIAWSAAAIENRTGAVPQKLVDVLVADVVPAPPPPPAPFAGLIDATALRNGVVPPHTKRDATGKAVLRNVADVTGITLHQTACVFGVGPRLLLESGGDRNLALRKRVLNIACHVAVLRNGEAVQTNDFRTYVHHGNGFNGTTLGVEIEGMYPGLVGKPKTLWGTGPATPLTQGVVDAIRGALQAMVVQGQALGMALTHVFAHRQASKDRQSDPGEEIWRKAVVEYAVPTLGLKAEQTKKLGTGRTIPTDWDPNGSGKY